MNKPLVNFDFQDIPVADLIKFFDEKRVGSSCPACEFTSTAIQADDKNNARLSVNEFAELKGNILHKVSGVIHPTVMTVCNNCGYVRNFSAHRVILWMKERENLESAGK